ncbi:hypothetical protein ACWDHW_07710 [Streptomyces melanosporofaciens]|uniref:hypothetical protein n=1 Tax=unclassified Streptomyces TaxID=2593676 RepID=UPI0036CC7234
MNGSKNLAAITMATALAGVTIGLASPAHATTTSRSRVATSAASAVYFISSSPVTIPGCKAWMNGKKPGPKVQGLVQTWSGSDCAMRLEIDHNQQTKWADSAGTGGDLNKASTHFHYDGRGYKARVCVNNLNNGWVKCGAWY